MTAINYVNKLPLPDYPYVPGKTPRHEEGFLDHIIAEAAEVTESQTANQNLPWLYGIRLYEYRYFWEAHEVWEAVWMRAPQASRERFLVQSAIHVANARLKFQMGRTKAGERLIHLASESLDRAYAGLQMRKSGNRVMQYEKSQFIKEYAL